EKDLPTDIQKRKLYETGRTLLKTSGYEDIGMDHFALPHDNLYLAQRQGRLHRNFMGYTTTNTELLIGLGASAISDAKYAYAQNLKKLEAHRQAVAEDRLPVFKGHILTEEDQEARKFILQIACQGKVTMEGLRYLDDSALKETLREMRREGILKINADGFEVTDSGRPFLRNICTAFDRRIILNDSTKDPALFSKSI
ncbi:MAG: coproporphyrinogen III oxidase, partial [Cyclobacteriaceae bacterium]